MFDTIPSTILVLWLPEICQQRIQKVDLTGPCSYAREICLVVVCPQNGYPNLFLPRIPRETGPVSEEGISRKKIEGPWKNPGE